MDRKRLAVVALILLSLCTVIGVYAGTIGVNDLFGFTNGYGFTDLNSTNVNAGTEFYRGGVNYTQFIASRYGSDQSLNTTDDVTFNNVTSNYYFLNAVNKTDIFAYPQQPASYIIWRDGATYYAKDGTTGIVTSNAVASTLINSVSGHRFLKTGTYNITAPITIDTGEIFEGEGPQNTILYLNNGVDDNVIESTSKNSIVIQGFSINGNKANNAAGTGIYFLTMDTAEVNNLNIINCDDYGIHISGSNAIRINNNYIMTNDDGGIYDYRSDNTVIFETIIQYNGVFGIYTTDGGNPVLSSGILIEGGWFESDAVFGNQTNHIKIDAISATVKSNRINAAGLGSDLILVEDGGTYCNIEDNYLIAAQAGADGIVIEAGAVGVTLRNNVLTGVNGYTDAGTRTVIYDPYQGSTTSLISVQSKTIYRPETMQTISAVGNIINHNSRFVIINTTGPSYLMTSNPTITDGVEGEIITIMNSGTGAGGAVTLKSQSNGLLLGAPFRTLDTGGTITLIYKIVFGTSYWVELSNTYSEKAATPYGTSAILNAATSIAVTHNCRFTPLISDIFITPSANTTNPVGLIWVDTIGATQFTVHCAFDPGVSTLPFGWKVVLDP